MSQNYKFFVTVRLLMHKNKALLTTPSGLSDLSFKKFKFTKSLIYIGLNECFFSGNLFKALIDAPSARLTTTYQQSYPQKS